MRQLILLALGLAGSLYTARRIAHRRYLTPARRRATLIPFTALILVLGALNVVMFVFPMAHRMWIHTARSAVLPGFGILREAAHVSWQISTEQLRRAMGSTELGTPPAWASWASMSIAGTALYNSKYWSNNASSCVTGRKGGRYLQGDPDDVTRPGVPAGIDSQRGSQPQRPPR